jgi:Kef-type K+ transport system membrane component KefB
VATQFISLFVAALAAALAPLIARLIPNGLVPETVILLVAGAALGPYALGAIQLDESITMISELGLAFLFLLAGYEINPRTLKSRQGKRGLVTWIATFGIATLVILLSHTFSITHFDGIAVAIALTTTALGMLIPIMKERNLDGTETGEAMLAYGTWGEVCPIIAMALLLSSRSEWRTLLILLAFMVLCVVLAVIPARSRKVGSRVYRFLASKRHTTSQTFVRAVVVLLIGLVTLSAVFGLDIVLGSFAAGFVLRFVIPEGSEELEAKLNAIGHGFLIPIFFVVSGAKINLTSIGDQPLLLAVFIVALLLVRAVPIVVAMSVGRGKSPLSPHNRITVALYCTTALPLIVAVTSVATNAGALSQSTASVLVAAGAISVFLMPLLASLTYRVVDSNAPEADTAEASNETAELLGGREEDR